MKPDPQTIVCPVFGESAAALRCAGILAKTFGARLLLLRISVSEKPESSVRKLERLEGLEMPILEGVHYERFELAGEPASGIREFVKRENADIMIVDHEVDSDPLSALGPRVRSVVESVPCTVMIVKEPNT